MAKDAASLMVRCFSVIRLLERDQWTSKEEIAAQIGRSVRQVERILSQLDEMGFPIAHERAQGYKIQSTRASLPVRLTADETWALLLLQRCALAEVGSGARQSLNNLTDRIRSQLSIPAAEALGEMQAWVASERVANGIAMEVWQVITECLTRGLQMRFDYHKLAQPASQRRVDPWGIFAVGRVWYLQAFDHQGKASRNFRLNRIQQPVILDFKATRPLGYQAAKHLFHRFEIGDGEKHMARLYCEPLLHSWLLENPLHPEQEVVGEGVQVPVRNLDLFVNVLMALEGLQRVEPDWLHTLLLKKLSERISTLSDGRADLPT
jgi:predicted DNA-binding transcriptional regulator YafY